MSFWENILLFFSFQALLMSVFFLLKRNGNRYANKLFSLFLFLFSYNVFFNVLYWTRFDEELYVLLSYTYFIPLSLYGPVFYLYVRSIITNEKISSKDVFHSIPLIAVLVFYGHYYLMPLETKLDMYHAETLRRYVYSILPYVDYYLTFSLIIYNILLYRNFIRYYKRKIDLKLWLTIVSISYLFFVLGIVSYYVLARLGVVKAIYDYYNTAVMSTFIFLVSYLSVAHPDIVNGKSFKEILPLVKGPKYEKTGLSKSFSLELKNKLEHIMDVEKPYLNHELRLDDIAEMLDVSRHHASQVINEHFRMSFFDYINRYRIMEAEKMLGPESDVGQEQCISDVAYQCGFNNRVSFYKAFKKISHTTPSEYRDNSNQSL